MKFRVTIFNNVFAKSCRGEDTTVEELADLIMNTRAPEKSGLPLLKFVRFGPLRTPPMPVGGGGSLRHDANVTMTSGVEGDYDGEAMPFAEAVTRLDEAGSLFGLYFALIYLHSPTLAGTLPVSHGAAAGRACRYGQPAKWHTRRRAPPRELDPESGLLLRPWGG